MNACNIPYLGCAAIGLGSMVFGVVVWGVLIWITRQR